MNVEQLRDYCLTQKGAYETFPFDEVTLVIKVMEKLFAIIPLDTAEASIALKCDPEQAIEWREQYDAVQAGYHLNKKHWNTVFAERGIPDALIRQMIDHSYACVVKGLSKAHKETLANL